MSLLKILESKEKEKTCNEEINVKDIRNNFLLSKCDNKVPGNPFSIYDCVSGSGSYSFYAHLSRIDVVEGMKVKQGNVIGIGGATQKKTSTQEVQQDIIFILK